MKNRMSVIDIRAIVAELKEQIIGMRLANLYDINPKTYLLKFAKTDLKVHVLAESGIRIHSTDFERDKSRMPSHFVLKIRKYIRAKRLENLEQVGVDRIVDFTFGTEEKAFHLIIEFYAKGNVVLTDHQYKIIALLRTHSKEAESGLFAVGEIYPMTSKRHFEPITKHSLALTIKTALDEKEKELLKGPTVVEGNTKQKGNLNSLILKNVLTNNLEYGSGFVEHCLLLADIISPNLNLLDAKQEKTKQLLNEIDSVLNNQNESHTILDKLTEYFKMADDFILKIKTEKQRGFIILKETVKTKQLEEVTVENPFTKSDQLNENSNEGSSSTDPLPITELNELQLKQIEMMKEEKRLDIKRVQYEDFTPILFEQVKRKLPTNPEQEIKVIEFESFDKCADEFFSAIEAKRIENQKQNVESTVEKKVLKVKKEQELKLQELQKSTDKYERIASLIKKYYEMVDQAIQVICTAIAQAQPWETIKQIIKEHRDVDPIARMIQKLKLETSQITIILPPPGLENEEDEDDEEEEKEEPTKIDIDISLSAHANAAHYYSLRKKSAENKEKASHASKKAIKKTEQKSTESAKKQQIKSDITIRRKRFWFEKFYWFITSENYLVLGGRDAQQNELIVKRYMRKGDIYVHADVHGASSCIIKNPTGEPIPPLSLQEAGMFCVCRSAAWDSKVMTAGYWVYDHQVSKTAPSGEYLTTGSFMIRGKKNYLPPAPLVMGFTIMFKVDESCIPNHLEERKPRMNAEEALTYLNNGGMENIEFDETESTTTGTYEEETVVSGTDKSGPTKDENVIDDNVVNHNPKVTDEEVLEIIEEKPSEEEISPTEKKKGLSAKDKKILKQLKKRGIDEKEAKEMILFGNLPDEFKQQEKQEKQENSLEKEESHKNVPAQKPKGMKQGKWKKLKTKYADQDEEERQLMIELIGNKPKDKKKEKEPEKKVKEEEIRKKQKEQEEIKRVLEEENIPYMDEEDKEKLTEIDSLTGQPRDDDIFLFAIPVCAPYSCLKSYKYKVKLVPGNQKRGKAGKDALSIIRTESRGDARIEACLKAIEENDITATMVGNCRIATASSKKSNFGKPKSKKTTPKVPPEEKDL
ncbi:hypothetical protein ABK040_010855 [Willaertia magna]